jgi:ribosome-associated protein YbcJ (S4-like RNA binding protein)
MRQPPPGKDGNMTIALKIRDKYIQIDPLLKTMGLCHSGGHAHA